MATERRYEWFAACIERRMRELNLIQKDLCREAGMSKEFVRKMLEGRGVPSGEKLDRLAKTLQMDRERLRKLLLKDVGAGDVARNMTARYASLQPLEEVWDQLTIRQQEDLATFANYLARRNCQPAKQGRSACTNKAKQ